MAHAIVLITINEGEDVNDTGELITAFKRAVIYLGGVTYYIMGATLDADGVQFEVGEDVVIKSSLGGYLIVRGGGTEGVSGGRGGG